MGESPVESERATRESRFFGLAAGAIVLVGVALRFYALDFGLPQPNARPDEGPTLDTIAAAARGDFDTGYSIYPYAYFYLHWLWGEATLAIAALMGIVDGAGYASTFDRDPLPLYVIGRMLSATAL